MEITFADESLAEIETENAGKTGLPISVIRTARRKILMLRAINDERTLRNWRNLRFCDNNLSDGVDPYIELGPSHRLIVEFVSQPNGCRMTLLSVQGVQ